jgi:ABC-2 type transport system permease protein
LPEDSNARGVGVNIVGYMMMFLLIISVSNLFAFAEDKEQGQLRRIAAAPISFVWYLGVQYIYCFSLLIPEYLMLIIIKLCGGNIGFSLGEYAILMGLLALLGISFGLLLHTFIQKPDNANMLGNSVAVLTSILAGSFYSFTKENSFFDHMIELVPQRQLMNLAFKFQNNTLGIHERSILYILVVSLVLFVVSVISLRNQYVKSV